MLTAIRDHALAQAEGADASDPISGTVTSFLSQVFPAGLLAVTSASYVDELSEVDAILDKLKGSLSETADELGLSRLARRLESLAGEYRAALENRPVDMVAFGDVRAARADCQRRLLETVAIIIGAYPTESAAHVAERARLLEPIMAQNNAIARLMRARRVVEDVDPDSGDVKPPEGPGPVTPPA